MKLLRLVLFPGLAPVFGAVPYAERRQRIADMPATS